MDPKEMRRLMERQLEMSQRLKARVRELEQAVNPPLAVVGLGLRFPGGLTTPAGYWDFLLRGADGTRGIPPERTGLRSAYSPEPGLPGHSYVDRGGFLDEVTHFDPGFFGLSQREAEALDPQQRLLLETSWEAMERAGIAVRRQERLDAGVFTGIMTSDYTDRLRSADRGAIDPYYGTGGGHSMAAGRVAYVMGLSGPAISVDTACSSSLVALHLGAQSLRRGECRYALVGGTNLIFSPDLMVSLCQSGALAPDGRTKAFLDSADGYGRGEGAGVLVLMRLADAEREGRPVLAVVRGSAVNHDGASSGLTVPNGPAQQEVVRAALRDAGVAPEDVGYVETHGTGTSLGDPVEARALDAVLGTGAPGRKDPLAIGSVKSRIGHLESAAGVAALIKVVLMLRHGRIPAAASDADGPLNHLIPWDRMRLDVPRATRDWDSGAGRRVAGVSAFGMSGTNAHAVLEEYRPAEPQAGTGTTGPRTELLTVSARDPESLRALAEDVMAHLAGTAPGQLASVCATLRDGRTAFEHRVAVTGDTAEQLAERLAAAAQAYAPPAGRRPAPVTALSVPGTDAELDKGITALVTAWPALGEEPGDAGVPARDPAGRLRALLRRLGIRAGERTASGSPSAVAELEWDGRAHPLLTQDPEAAPGLLLEVLAALFRSGADLRLDRLRPAGAGRPDDLPTYAFHRKRCWIDEPAPAGTAPAGAVPEAPVADTPAAAGPDREAVTGFLAAELRQVLHADEDLDTSRTFLDAGGDSFAAMQLTIRIEEEYETEVPMEAFDVELPLEELFDRLSGHITGALAGGTEEDTAA
ncbi:hypothetical protein GCM10009716_14860 [Streptomyces sodiiphilus]|uniref:Carrier domain-containing protein n=1 Tax=Streptomyces sodiiphilus TaxID=226217 RepID=A0ABN2P1A4_9ACTN